MGLFGPTLYLDLVGGPFCGGRAADTGLLCYAVGDIVTSHTGQRVWQVGRTSSTPVPHRDQQWVYRRRIRKNRHWYELDTEIDLDAA